jgi:hypothetical protein
MTKLKLGNQYDDSKSELKLDTDGATNLSVEGGDLRNRSTQTVDVIDRGQPTTAGGSNSSTAKRATSVSPTTPHVRSSRRIWAVGSFLLLALLVVAAVLAAIARLVSPLMVPLIVVASIVLLYIVAIAVLPSGSGRRMLKASSIISEFMKLVFAGRSNGKSDDAA